MEPSGSGSLDNLEPGTGGVKHGLDDVFRVYLAIFVSTFCGEIYFRSIPSNI